MLDLRFTDVCSFDTVTEEFKTDEIHSINPFLICLNPSFGVFKFKVTVIESVEWLSMILIKNENDERNNQIIELQIDDGKLPILMVKGEQGYFSFNVPRQSGQFKLIGSFRLLQDPTKEIINHEWDFLI